MTRVNLFLWVVLLASLIRAVSGQLGNGDVKIEWDYPSEGLSTNLTFHVYTSTNPATPLTNWTHLAVVVGTNTAVTVHVTPGVNCFTVTASNWWGESGFSEVAMTPELPRGDSKLRVKRAD